MKPATKACALLALLVVFAFVAIDVSVLNRLLISFKNTPEHFDAFDSRTPYTRLSATTPLAKEPRRVEAQQSKEECEEKCTLDDGCRAFVYDGVKSECQLLYNISGFARSDAMYTTASGIKQRDSITDTNGKYLRFEGRQLPASNAGKISEHQMVKSVHECKSKCEEKSVGGSKCIAFEYDFDDKACTLNSVVNGELQLERSKDVYVVVN